MQVANSSTQALNISGLYSRFSFTDTLGEQDLNATCPTIFNLISSNLTAAIKTSGGRLISMYKNGSEAVLDDFIKALDPSLFKVWRFKLATRSRLMILNILTDSRQAYTYSSVSRTIPWEVAKDGRVLSTARQSCSWGMCLPKLLLADTVCMLYKVCLSCSDELLPWQLSCC
jgi:hypothetical protein